MLIATDATGTPTSPDSIATILPSDLPAVTSLTSGVNAIAATVQTALTNNYLRKTSGNVVNADINASAAIAYSKLNLATSVVNADISATAAIAPSKITKVPYCLAYRSNASGTQAFGAANGVINYSASIETTAGAMWVVGSPSRITIPLTGYYRVVVAAAVSGATLGAADIFSLRKNGATILVSATNVGVGGETYVGEVGVFNLTAAEYLELSWVRSTATGITTVVNVNSPIAPDQLHFGAIIVQYLGA